MSIFLQGLTIFSTNSLSFIRLADYLIVGTLHVLAVNSVQSLFNYYTEQLESTPTPAEIQATNKMPEKKDEDDMESKSVEKLESASKPQMATEEKEEDKVVPPLYKTELVLTIETLSFQPDIDNFRDSIGEIMQQFKDTLLQVENLVPDKYFDAFTRLVRDNYSKQKKKHV